MHRIERYISWEQLARAHQTRMVTSLYAWLFVVPLVANFLAALPDSITVPVLHQKITINLTLPFSWILLYTGAIFVVASNLIYQVWCPKILKDHPTYNSFFSDRKESSHLNDYSKQLEISYDYDTKYNNTFTNYNRMVSGSITEQSRVLVDVVRTMYWDIHKLAILENRRARLCCGISLGLGLVLASIVTLQGIAKVFKIAIRSVVD